MFKQYCQCDAVLFPSKLETWGLPISESKDYSKPILASDLQYARETIGTYTNVSFLPPDDFYQWADAIKGIILNEWVYSGNIEKKITPPFAKDWNHLWTILKEGL